MTRHCTTVVCVVGKLDLRHVWQDRTSVLAVEQCAIRWLLPEDRAAVRCWVVQSVVVKGNPFNHVLDFSSAGHALCLEPRIAFTGVMSKRLMLPRCRCDVWFTSFAFHSAVVTRSRAGLMLRTFALQGVGGIGCFTKTKKKNTIDLAITAARLAVRSKKNKKKEGCNDSLACLILARARVPRDIQKRWQAKSGRKYL